MSLKASRFPGRTRKNSGNKAAVVFQESSNGSSDEYSKIAAQTAKNLKMFRSLYGSKNEVIIIY